MHIMIMSLEDEYTEDVLSAHESELDRMRGFYSDNADLFKLVEKRQSLWRQKLEFDVSVYSLGSLHGSYAATFCSGSCQ